MSLFAAGCPQPADLENVPACCGPNAPAGSGGSGGGGASGAGGSGPTCETACITTIFTTSNTTQCKICHYADTSALPSLGKLDLSTGFTPRLRNVRAKHVDIDPTVHPSPVCPTDDYLIDTENPDKSWLWKKVSREVGTCGDPMPGTPLSAGDMTCIETYIECVSGGKQLSAAGGAGGGGGGAGGGGATSAGTGGT